MKTGKTKNNVIYVSASNKAMNTANNTNVC